MTNGQQKEWRKERRINEYGSLDQRRKDEQVLIEEEEEDVVCCSRAATWYAFPGIRVVHALVSATKVFLVYRKKVFFLLLL